MFALALHLLAQIFDRDGALRHLGQIDDEVDHLVLEDRRAQIGHGLGRLLVELEDLALLAGILLGLAEQGHVGLFLGDLDAVQAPDLGNQQPQADPALGDLPVVFLELVLAFFRILRVQFAGLPVLLDLPPDGLEFDLDHALRDREFVRLRQKVEQLPLHPDPGDGLVFRAEARPDACPERLQVGLPQGRR